MDTPKIEVHNAMNIWSGCEYKGHYLKPAQQFVTLEDYLATLDYIQHLLDERNKANG